MSSFQKNLRVTCLGKKVGENRLATKKMSAKNKIVEKIL